MTYLLLPGRQIVNTAFQEAYLTSILGKDLARLPEMVGDAPQGPVTEIVFAVTSCNKSNSRYNPLPFEIRAILVYEFARRLKAEHGIGFRVIGIPNYPPTERFAEIVLKEIEEQTDGHAKLTPKNTVVFTSTPAIIAAYRKLGFAILPGEFDLKSGTHTDPVPNDIARQIGEGELPLSQIPLSGSTRTVFEDMPEVVERIRRLYHDPVLTELGDLTETRDYNTYARSMAGVVDLKYNEIKPYILPGKIVDEGCADGALIERIVRDFPDSDIIGIDLSAEMLARANELKRAGAFGDAFVFFKQQNLMSPVTDAQEMTCDTVICNSTLHELWSYGRRAESVREYLRNKLKQLRPEGRLVIRDVVGPTNGEREVYLWCNAADGIASQDGCQKEVEALSTLGRFLRFTEDFCRKGISREAESVSWSEEPLFLLPLRDAMEFITKMDYTDNWLSEMHEEFCFWDYGMWVRELASARFLLHSASYAYVNQWRVENRFRERVRLFELDGAPCDFPITNMVLIGQKPRAGRG